jgi:carbonic anhydrase/acetyltransferase-like protein (isoleucine patch superfamily)
MQRGLKVGKNVYIQLGVEFDPGYPYLIEIGDDCRITGGVMIMAHDATTFRDLGITRIAPVRILEGSFIGYGATILPGVTIGPRALVAARSFVNRDVGEDMAVAGNPARRFGSYSEILKSSIAAAQSATVFSREELDAGVVTEKDLVDKLKNTSFAYMRGVPKRDPYYVNADFSEMRANAIRAFERTTLSQATREPNATPVK